MQVQLASTCDYLLVRLARAQRLGQTDRQVVASGGKLNLRGDLRWAAKWTRKFPRKYTQVAKKKKLRQTVVISFLNNRLIDVTQLALTLARWRNGEKLALTCMQIGTQLK